MVTVDSLTFDVSGCELLDKNERLRVWKNPAGVVHELSLSVDAPRWTFDLTDGHAAAVAVREECARAGVALLSVETMAVGGCEALNSVIKTSAPKPYHLGWFYFSNLWFLFSDCHFHLKLSALERGTTGTRESMVNLIQLQQPGRPASSDDPLYDAAFPSHPLSLVRARMREVVKTLELSADARALKPFRLGAALEKEK